MALAADDYLLNRAPPPMSERAIEMAALESAGENMDALGKTGDSSGNICMVCTCGCRISVNVSYFAISVRMIQYLEKNVPGTLRESLCISVRSLDFRS